MSAVLNDIGINISNVEFLAAVFDKLDANAERIHVCGFIGEPSTRCGVGRQRYSAGDKLPAATRTPTTPSPASRPGWQAARSRTRRVYVIPPGRRQRRGAIAPATPCRRPASYQAGYSVTARRRHRACQAAAFGTAEGRAHQHRQERQQRRRYVRLPVGQNMKAAYALRSNSLHDWQPQIRYSIEQI